MHTKSIETVLQKHYREPISISKSQTAYGGDISNSSVLSLSNGEKVFCKTNTIKKAEMFAAEAACLEAIAKTITIRTPEVYGYGIDKGRNCSYILMEAIVAGTKANNFWEIFGTKLAAMHKSDTEQFLSGKKYGFMQDGYIGNSVQYNTPKDSWIEFFRDCRLLPQIKMASVYFDKATIKRFDVLLSRLDDLLIEPEYPSLLHGDLWGGNFMTGSDGNAWLIDPAVYVGHREADLAMTELFGGFSIEFYEAYNEAAPLQPGYKDRRDLYNLYHLLNHLNLFGEGYLPDVLQTLYKYTRI